MPLAASALDDELIEAPVAQVHDPQATENDGHPRQIAVLGVPGIQNHVELVGRLFEQTRKTRRRAPPPADGVKRDPRDEQAAQHEHAHLDQIGHCNGSQASVERIDDCENHESDHRRHC